MIPLPKGWKEEFGTNCNGRTGWYWPEKKLIRYCFLPKWMIGIRQLIMYCTMKHERGHAWGIEGCNKPWCIMFEAATWNEKWRDCKWERRLVGFIGLFTFYGFCCECKTRIEKNNNL